MSHLTLVVKLAHPHALYKCSCGALHIARSSQVSRGRVKSCGCLRSAVTAARNTKHGMSGTPLYAVWVGMLGRCQNPAHQAYENYGARGIGVAERWHKFQNFYADMGDPPAKFTLERRDNSLGYSEANCYWASMKSQQNNKRNNVLLTFKNETLNVTQWAEKLDVPRQLIYDRIRSGWSAEQALTQPKRNKA